MQKELPVAAGPINGARRLEAPAFNPGALERPRAAAELVC